MSQNIAAWFTEKIKDQVIVSYQSHGGMLDNTMMNGDVVANTVKFPIIGRTEVYKLTGAIERVPANGPSLTTVQMQFEDFEASDFWRTQDAYKAGPNEQNALAQIITKAIRRKRDTIKLDALAAFSVLGGSGVTTIGTGAEVPDLLQFEQGAAEIAGVGCDDDIYCGLPAKWMSQLKFYKEFADADWVGADDTPFSKKQRQKMRTIGQVTYIELPDEYFVGPDGNSLYTYMWAKEAMGAEMPWNQEAPSITPQPLLQGTPYLVKAGLGGAAIGIQGAGVKRFWLKKITNLIRPPVPTQTVP
ncbi:phage capsid protein [Mesorhizobium sp. WSM4976]|uniref:phage capsid protein n=1 Tax=Mesorhizobium sp. WSM4976 TaxID=3038549 RepID=UPI0024160FE8|nr:phage capsid protein [Mesorhizobium sp. WSM4976]MDG4894623.1 phage capsid protein [Mesorhizobium sp. WSM4976]